MATPTTVNGIFSSAVAATPAVEATGTNAAEGISASSDTGAGVSGTSASGNGGMFGSWGGAAAAAAAWKPTGNGVLGVVGPGAPPVPVAGVVGVNQAPTVTIPNQGPLPGGPGVFGTSINGSGVEGVTGSASPAVNGSNTGGGSGVQGNSVSGVGVWGISKTGNAGQFDGNVLVHGILTVGSPAINVQEAISALMTQVATLQQQVARLNNHVHSWPATGAGVINLGSIKDFMDGSLGAAPGFANSLIPIINPSPSINVPTSPPEFGTSGP